MNNGEWNAILTYLEEKNNNGKEEICRCSQCNGTFKYDRAYINDDGDFVISQDTLRSLLIDARDNYEKLFTVNASDLSKAGSCFAKYWQKEMETNTEDARLQSALAKREYGED